MEPFLEKISDKNSSAKHFLYLLSAFCGIYIFFLFPKAYFRHDDWLILGNGIFRLATDWKFAFRPTLFGHSGEETWFFRPLFKISALLYYQAFGLNYQAWLIATLAMLVGAVAFAYKTILTLTQSSFRALTFAVLFVCSIHFHFGSAIWIGEGLMNSPQLFLLFLSSYLFTLSLSRSTIPLSTKTYWLALALYLFSLGFKEAGIVHTALLFGIAGTKVENRSISLRAGILSLLPYAVVTSLYLIGRVLFLPLNESYAPHFSGPHVVSSLTTLGAALLAPLFIFAIFLRLQKREIKTTANPFYWSRLALFLPVLISLLPYIGHPFFSPGWLLGPGLYLAFALCLMGPELKASAKYFLRLGALLVAISLPPVWYKLNSIGWWQWHVPQQKINDIFKEYAQSNINEVVIVPCFNPNYPDVSFSRVVGFPAGISSLWALHSNRHIDVRSVWCHQEKEVTKSPSRLILKFEFPNLTVLR